MTPTALAILLLSLATAGEGLGLYLQHRARAQERQEAALQLQEASAALGECQARVTAESLEAAAAGTTDALEAAMAPDLAEVGVRLELVRTIPLVESSRAVLELDSPRLTAAWSWSLLCAGLGGAGKDSAVHGCGREMVVELQAAVAAQDACATTSPTGALPE